jgi:hypothetical protein
MATALPFYSGLVRGKLGYIASMGAQSGLEPYGGFVGEHLVRAGFNGIHYCPYQVGRVRLGPG